MDKVIRFRERAGRTERCSRTDHSHRFATKVSSSSAREKQKTRSFDVSRTDARISVGSGGTWLSGTNCFSEIDDESSVKLYVVAAYRLQLSQSLNNSQVITADF